MSYFDVSVFNGNTAQTEGSLCTVARKLVAPELTLDEGVDRPRPLPVALAPQREHLD